MEQTDREAMPASMAPSSSGQIPFHRSSEKRRRHRRHRRRPSPDLYDDLTVEIILRLPAKSVARFGCVSKLWLSVSSQPKFVRSHRLRHHTLSGFFLKTLMRNSTYFHMDPCHPPPPRFHPTLSLPGIAAKKPNSITIDSLSGDLILYRCKKQELKSRSLLPDTPRALIFICNLKTLELTTMPQPERLEGPGHVIVSDPSRFPPNHYKIISSRDQLHVYSSETQSWKLLLDPSPLTTIRNLYWEGSLFWVGWDTLFRLDVEGEFVDTVPWPENKRTGCQCHYLGESRGRLHLLTSYHCKRKLDSTQFDLFGMDNLSSGWSVIHRVDLKGIKDVYPEVAIPLQRLPGQEEEEEGGERTSLRISVVYFHRGGGGIGRGDQLFLSIPGKIVVYDLQNRTFTTVADNVIPQNEGVEDCRAETEYSFFQFLPYLAPSLSSP